MDSMLMQTRYTTLIWGIALVLLLIGPGPSLAQDGPVDPFAGASPAFDDPLPEGQKLNVGDWGVAEQRGAATYTYRIDVPPGRNAMAPTLVLRYSSHSPLRGGVAVGWTLADLPSIRIDLSLGQMEGRVYTAALGSASGRLVEVPDAAVASYPGQTYRVDSDASFTRFALIGFQGLM
jgi:hypothetical protein